MGLCCSKINFKNSEKVLQNEDICVVKPQEELIVILCAVKEPCIMSDC